MNITDKIRIILEITGDTQEQLAKKIGISFVALNSIINKRSNPRKKTREKIDQLYLEHTGQKQIPNTLLASKKQIIKDKQKRNKNILSNILKNKNLLDQIVLSLTYNTNRIEGSTLSENETAAILFENISLKDKTLVEQLEAKNHQTALLYLFDYLYAKKEINEKLILKLHTILLNGINTDAGFYRRHGVRIMGANIATANYLKVPQLMKDMVRYIQKDIKDVITHTVKTHSRFEKIHPFSDGNGRIGRLLVQAMLLKNNLPPALIKQEEKVKYLKYLNISQTKKDYSLLENFACDAILNGYKIIER